MHDIVFIRNGCTEISVERVVSTFGSRGSPAKGDGGREISLILTKVVESTLNLRGVLTIGGKTKLGHSSVEGVIFTLNENLVDEAGFFILKADGARPEGASHPGLCLASVSISTSLLKVRSRFGLAFINYGLVSAQTVDSVRDFSGDVVSVLVPNGGTVF